MTSNKSDCCFNYYSSLNYYYYCFYCVFLWILLSASTTQARRTRSASFNEENSLNSIEHIWATTAVAVGDTAVLHCSFDALFHQLKNGNIDWFKESPISEKELQKQRLKQQQELLSRRSSNSYYSNRATRKRKRNHHNSPHYHHQKLRQQQRRQRQINNVLHHLNHNKNNIDPSNFYYHNYQDSKPVAIATGRTLVVKDKRFRVYRPHNSALSVLIIRRVRKKDAGYFRCNLAGSSTKHKYMLLNVTDSKIEAEISPKETKSKVDDDITLWCNATGYPIPVVYWTRDDRNRTLPDGSLQYWGNGLFIKSVSEYDTGVYVCYLDNFVNPVVHHKFSLIVEDNPWMLDGYKMRYDSSNWFPTGTLEPLPSTGKSFLLMCETRGSPNPQPTITWYKDREPVHSGKNYYIIDDSSDWKQNFVSSTLVIIRYGPQFEGKYICIATNGFRLKRQRFYVSDSKSKVKHFTTSLRNKTTPTIRENRRTHRIEETE